MRPCAILLVLLAAAAGADERILRFDSEIIVMTDGSMLVTETITVRAEGRQIRRGIFRDYPVRYEDRLGNNVQVVYEPRTVLRNGEPEEFHTERRGDSVRTYFGSADVFLPTGEHTYEYRYKADRMLGFFESHDEIYWNVTGNDWAFPIDYASATVTLQFSVPAEDLELAGYTGDFGSTSRNYRSSVDSDGRAIFETTSPLQAGAGLTIAVGWPKGFVEEPGDLQQFIWLLSDNLNFLIVLAGLIAMLLYYIPVWKSHGRDPAPGVVFTRYEPPEGFSPASLRYIMNMGYDTGAMTAAVVNLAVKGYLRISESDDKHSLRRLDTDENLPPMAPGERELYDELFKKSGNIGLVNENYERIGGAQKAHKKSLKRDYHIKYFRTNGLLNLPALLIAVISSLVALRIGPSVLVIATIAAMGIVIVFFAIVMKQPTGLGRRLLDEMEGFKEFLEVAEKDEMNLRNPPEKTPALFESYLPYALALGVEQQWAERFASVFAKLKSSAGRTYHPSWYSGNWDSRNLGANMSNLSGGLGDAISTSVSPPGSSSGSGGGGFSGGGGGGGGGGGW